MGRHSLDNCHVIFFRIFGEDVLFTPGTDAFMYSIAILLVGTAILLTLVIYLYTLFDKKDYAAIRFGIVGTMTGLVLDSFVFFKLSNDISKFR